MDLLQLKYFCNAAESQNFSKTAEKYAVPPSDISQSIKRLEKELNIMLFDRSANKIAINECGKMFYERIKQALNIIEDAKNVLGDLEYRVYGDIKICICANRRIVTSVIEKFKMKYCDVSFIISHSPQDIDNEFDFIIGDETFEKKGYDKEQILTEKIILALQKNDPIAKKKKIYPEDLKNRRFITMPCGCSLHYYTKAICNFMGFEPDIAIQSDDPHHLRKYIQLGFGIALIPELSWKGQFYDNIVFRDIGNFARKTYILKRSDRYITKKEELFLDMLKKECLKNELNNDSP